MEYVEFVGLPGSGKTSLHQKVIQDQSLYGGLSEDGVERQLLNILSSRASLLYNLIPSPIQTVILDHVIEPRIRRNMFVEFSQNHPRYLNILYKIAQGNFFNSTKLYTICKEVVEEYQLGISTTEDGELFVFDEGFIQRSTSILSRSKNGAFSIDDYVTAVPLPDLIVWIEAPVDICIQRQQGRGRIVCHRPTNSHTPRDTLQRLERLFEKLISHIDDQVTVVRIRNTDSISSSVNKIYSQLSIHGYYEE